MAQLTRARGNKGEIAAVPLSEHPERIKRAYVNGTPLDVERVWRHDGRLIFKFAGVDSISAAEALAGLDVCIPAQERAPLEAGSYYQSDLVGCQVVEKQSGRVLGTVEGWQEYGGPALLVIATSDKRELLIPFAASICEQVDAAAKRIVVALPEGLDEL
ncbi:MAG: 16S rRNA processing protein RimM [Acidobacteriaceae bacterium]|nr:16S rRNA processing protein RimM [Acidobacteriaceae bacterium]